MRQGCQQDRKQTETQFNEFCQNLRIVRHNGNLGGQEKGQENRQWRSRLGDGDRLRLAGQCGEQSRNERGDWCWRGDWRWRDGRSLGAGSSQLFRDEGRENGPDGIRGHGRTGSYHSKSHKDKLLYWEES